MAVDFKSFKKLETPAPSRQLGAQAEDLLTVLVKLRDGAVPPDYVSTRARITDGIFSAEIKAEDLARLEADPKVVSVSLSQRLTVIE